MIAESLSLITVGKPFPDSTPIPFLKITTCMKVLDKTFFFFFLSQEFLDSTQYDAVWVKPLCIIFI